MTMGGWGKTTEFPRLKLWWSGVRPTPFANLVAPHVLVILVVCLVIPSYVKF